MDNFTKFLLWFGALYYTNNWKGTLFNEPPCILALLCSFCSYFTLSFDAAISCCDTWTYISIQVIRLMKSRFAFLLCMYVMFNVAVLCCNLAFNWKKASVSFFRHLTKNGRFWDTLKMSGKYATIEPLTLVGLFQQILGTCHRNTKRTFCKLSD